MTTTQKQAAEHATKIQWDTYASFEYAYALLEECNMHTEAAALKEAHDKKMAEYEEMMAREFGQQ